MNQSEKYTSKNIVISKFPKNVQSSPGMYIGDPNDGGQEHLVTEIIINSVDEYLVGAAKNINISIFKNNFIQVEDDGRGIPTDISEYENDSGNKIKKSGVEVVFTVLHAGGKTGENNSYKISGGLHGVGASVVNALSEELYVEVYRKNRFSMKFKEGIIEHQLEEHESTEKKGTLIRFKPNTNIFKVPLNEEKILKQIEELAYLNAGLSISFYNEKENQNIKFYFPNGILDFIKKNINEQSIIFSPILYSLKEEDFKCEIVFTWFDLMDKEEEIYAYTNNVYQSEHGIHVNGFRSGLTKAVQNFLQKNKNISYINEFLKKYTLVSEDIRYNLTAIISIFTTKPMFSSQTKNKLVEPISVKNKIHDLVDKELSLFLEKNPEKAKQIISKFFQRAKIRINNKKEMETLYQINPEKFPVRNLSECHTDIPKEERELIIVEGESAAGTAKQGKSFCQAILPLKGKPTNVVKSKKVEKIESLMTIISVLGLGGINLSDLLTFSYENILEKLRYHKIILMTDADIDGSHIRSLLLTFFFEYLPILIDNGHLYISLPPLYCVNDHGKKKYLADENAFKDFFCEKIQEEYILFNNNKQLNNEDIKNLIGITKEYKIKLQKKWKGDIPLEIFSHLIFFLHQNKDINFIKNIIEKKFSIKLEEKNNFYKIISKTLYTENIYEVIFEHFDINNSLLNLFPLIIKNKKNEENILYEPMEIINYLEKFEEKVDIQRFKGLGEMNPDQLKVTSLDINTRKIIKINSENKENIKNIINDLMSNEGVSVRKQNIVDGMNTINEEFLEIDV